MLTAVYTPYVLYILTNALVCLVWGLRLESRVKLNEQVVIDLKELIIQRFDAQDKRLERIEKSLNGALKHE